MCHWELNAQCKMKIWNIRGVAAIFLTAVSPFLENRAKRMWHAYSVGQRQMGLSNRVSSHLVKVACSGSTPSHMGRACPWGKHGNMSRCQTQPTAHRYVMSVPATEVRRSHVALLRSTFDMRQQQPDQRWRFLRSLFLVSPTSNPEPTSPG